MMRRRGSNSAGRELFARLGRGEATAPILLLYGEETFLVEQAVVTVACVGIECHVADNADLRNRLLDGADRSADKVARVERFAARFVSQRGIGIGKQRDRRQAGTAEGIPVHEFSRQVLCVGGTATIAGQQELVAATVGAAAMRGQLGIGGIRE